MTEDDEKKEVENIAAGQRAFLDRNLPYPPDGADSPEMLQRKIIRLAVEAYIEESESTKKKLLSTIEVEKHKNRDIKDLAERLALEVQRLDPDNAFAAEALALLLENKMKAGESPKRKR